MANIKIVLRAENEDGEIIYYGEFARQQDLEEEGLRKLEGAIESLDEKNKDMAEENEKAEEDN